MKRFTSKRAYFAVFLSFRIEFHVIQKYSYYVKPVAYVSYPKRRHKYLSEFVIVHELINYISE